MKEYNLDYFLDDDELETIKEGDNETINSIGASRYSEGDYEEARIYYELAASMGNSIAMCNLGYMYMYGRGIAKDESIALAFFTISAKKGNIEATYKLGNLYYDGKVVEKDQNKAIELYEEALQLIEKNQEEDTEYPSIYFSLAKEMLPGGLKEQDISKAYKYLKIAREGYEMLIDDAPYYEKSLDDVYELLNSSIFGGIDDEK